MDHEQPKLYDAPLVSGSRPVGRAREDRRRKNVRDSSELNYTPPALTLAGTGSVLIGGASPGRRKSELVQLVDEQFVDVVRLVRRNAVPHHNTDDEE